MTLPKTVWTPGLGRIAYQKTFQVNMVMGTSQGNCEHTKNSEYEGLQPGVVLLRCTESNKRTGFDESPILGS